ncbi:MAG TPA: hypothetical protein PK020_05905 [Ilumatobacteraceae bacterium]|nr:hypothetical protein [Ilumatobacteraceae bacterium]HRB03011.1 hypothetical protein [Ilumatobacteraceae bacterium]
MTIDLGEAYREGRERISHLVTQDDIDPTLQVAATPGWTVHSVIAHLSGVADDASTGNMAGAPGEEWTAAQVARGAGSTVAELIDQWKLSGPQLEGFLSSPAGEAASAAVMDIHTHEADVHLALGRAVSVPAEFLAWAAPALRDGFADAVVEAGLPPVEVTASDFEWFRARLGRRTAAEVSAYRWSADPAPYLDSFFVFGRADSPLGEVPA